MFLKNKMKKTNILISFIVAFLFIAYFSSDTKFDELAFGQQTTAYYAKDNKKNELLHFSKISDYLINIDSLKNKILFFGNSQTHSINQIKQNQKNYVELINEKIGNVSSYTLANGNLMEFCISLNYITQKFKIDKLIIPLFMDDLRESEIRADIKNHYKNNPISLEFNDNSLSEYIKNEISYDKVTNKQSEGEKHWTTQDYSEELFNNYLNEYSFWNRRENIRGEFFIFLYKLRNTIFNIKPQSIRPMIKQNYDLNFTALKRIISICNNYKIKLYLYIPPIRNDVSIPYDLNEYYEFKNQVIELVSLNKKNVFYNDFDTIVPGEHWGLKDATNLIDKYELDFMHFNYNGHILLSEKLLKFIQ